MIRGRTIALAAGLVALLFLVGALRSLLSRHAHRRNPLVDLIGRAAPSLQTDRTLAKADVVLAFETSALLRHGSDPNAAGELDWPREELHRISPVSFAAMRRLPQTLRRLLRGGGNPNVEDELGRTPVIWATIEGNSRIIRILLAAGADPNHVDSRECTALDYADASSGGWDQRRAVQKALKAAHAHAGPLTTAKLNTTERFWLVSRVVSHSTSGLAWHGRHYHAETELTLVTQRRPLLSREKYDRLHVGMGYPEIAAILGADFPQGRMHPAYEGTLTIQEGARVFTLCFQDARLRSKSANGL